MVELSWQLNTNQYIYYTQVFNLVITNHINYKIYVDNGLMFHLRQFICNDLFDNH